MAEATAVSQKKTISSFRRWFFEGQVKEVAGPHEKEGQHPAHSWWRVMCLTGVDYFSTLGYQPSIAFVAAGALSPIATLILVLLTLFGALPIYSRVAQESPHGEGSISMLEDLLPRWRGKLFVLALLGFVATDFVITITLSAADATAHIIENPFMPQFLHGHRVGAFNVITHPEVIPAWKDSIFAMPDVHGNPLLMIGVALILFPKLALGLSGFETGVAVMPLVKGESGDDPKKPAGRIRNTRKLLISAALIMSFMLIASSLVTTMLIPAEEFRPATPTQKGGEADGRALSYLAHRFLGDYFGTAYDLSTILILWFAGASAMAGLLNIVPRYLPRFG